MQQSHPLLYVRATVVANHHAHSCDKTAGRIKKAIHSGTSLAASRDSSGPGGAHGRTHAQATVAVVIHRALEVCNAHARLRSQCACPWVVLELLAVLRNRSTCRIGHHMRPLRSLLTRITRNIQAGICGSCDTAGCSIMRNQLTCGTRTKSMVPTSAGSQNSTICDAERCRVKLELSTWELLPLGQGAWSIAGRRNHQITGRGFASPTSGNSTTARCSPFKNEIVVLNATKCRHQRRPAILWHHALER